MVNINLIKFNILLDFNDCSLKSDMNVIPEVPNLKQMAEKNIG